MASTPVAKFNIINTDTRTLYFKDDDNNNTYMIQTRGPPKNRSKANDIRLRFKICDNQNINSVVLVHILNITKITYESITHYELTYNLQGIPAREQTAHVVRLKMEKNAGWETAEGILDQWCEFFSSSNNTHAPLGGGFAPNIRF